MSSDVGPQLSPEELGEAVKLLQGLIRIDTTNPPGNEGKCAEYLKAFFERNGIDCEVIGEPGRESAVAKIDGANEKPRLLLLSHTDVVPAANVGTWKYPPFSGEIEGNWIYGRGAVDDKFDATAQAMAFVLTKRRNTRLNGTLLYVSVSDEEINGSGADWLTSKVPSKVAAEYVVGEGGGPPVKIGSRKAYRISTGEKGCVWLRLTARGRAGHGSIPTLADNANVKMAKAILNISNLKTKPTIHRDVAAETRLATKGLFGEKQGSQLIKKYLNARGLDILLDKIRLRDMEIAEVLRSITRMTISPNVVHGGTETNVIPGTCEGQVDIRLIPGQDRDDAIRTVRRCVKDLDVNVDAYQYSEVSASPSNTPFYDAIHSTLTEMSPEFIAVPQIITGASDSRFWRKLGSVVYGCVPLSYEAKIGEVSRGVHAANERVDSGSLSLGTTFLCKLI
ncbi:MAG TPA: M20/M25/M40 family metallo-hydrolase, partial [Candidatus Acidoferrales bacterium]|nr:M20/M25/M40 family metallo-hydrolase [Candidatus Acidoferrales bacterium]